MEAGINVDKIDSGCGKKYGENMLTLPIILYVSYPTAYKKHNRTNR
jgi:hypothetical protein